ncbi:unnamed protein product, partial [Rotaria socialis]
APPTPKTLSDLHDDKSLNVKPEKKLEEGKKLDEMTGEISVRQRVC